MTNPNGEDNLQQSTQLSEIKTQLSELLQKVTQLEDNLMLVPDIYRYEKLRKYLASESWFEADLETVKVISDITGKELKDLTPEDIREFPCNELKVIDQLWLKYSHERFGFSTQLDAYQSVGGNLDTTIRQERSIVEKWGDKLGWRVKEQWRKCDELDYSLGAPVGCHPSQWWNSPYGSKMTNYFLARLMSCKL